MLCNAWRTQHISLHCPCQRNKHSALRHWRTTCLCTVANPRHTFAMLATPASLPLGVGPFESNDPLGRGAHSAAPRQLLGVAEQQQGGRNPKRPRVEADKRRDALLHVQDKYADIDFTKYQKLVGPGDAGGAAFRRRAGKRRQCHCASGAVTRRTAVLA